MKKILLSLFAVFTIYSFTYVKDVNALYLKNNNGINISQEEYQNLINLGFNETEIMNMRQQEFDANKNLKGEVVSVEESNIIDNVEFNKTSIKGISNGYVETAGKKMTTTIVSIGSYYRYKVSLVWKNIPSTRSYDIIGIGKNTNVTYNSNIIFQQNYCYAVNNCTSNTAHNEVKSNTGGTAIFSLPTGSLTSLSSYMYYDVKKNTSNTITTQKAYGDYSHATTSISLANAKKHSIGSSGIVLDSSITNYYDSMATATATWTGSW